MATRRYSIVVRIPAGVAATAMAAATVYRLMQGDDQSLSLGTLAMIIGSLWLGFIAATGQDAVDYIRAKLEDRSNNDRQNRAE